MSGSGRMRHLKKGVFSTWWCNTSTFAHQETITEYFPDCNFYVKYTVVLFLAKINEDHGAGFINSVAWHSTSILCLIIAAIYSCLVVKIEEAVFICGNALSIDAWFADHICPDSMLALLTVDLACFNQFCLLILHLSDVDYCFKIKFKALSDKLGFGFQCNNSGFSC